MHVDDHHVQTRGWRAEGGGARDERRDERIASPFSERLCWAARPAHSPLNSPRELRRARGWRAGMSVQHNLSALDVTSCEDSPAGRGTGQHSDPATRCLCAGEIGASGDARWSAVRGRRGRRCGSICGCALSPHKLSVHGWWVGRGSFFAKCYFGAFGGEFVTRPPCP